MHAHYQSAAHEAQAELQAEWENELETIEHAASEHAPDGASLQAPSSEERYEFPEAVKIDESDPFEMHEVTPQHVIDTMAERIVERKLREIEDERDEEEEETDEPDGDEEYGEPQTLKEQQIEIVVFWPGQYPKLIRLDNTLSAMQKLVGGRIEVFSVGVSGAIGVCNEEFLDLGLPANRYVRAAGTVIAGAFFVAGDGVNMGSLSPRQVVETMLTL